ncbi:MAG: nucleotidyltransferase domain-containing protein [Rhodomicrobium sp.]
MNSTNLNAEDIIATLRANEAVLREHGITHAALFGSRARGDNRPDSDIDILIDTQPDAVHTVYDYAGIKLLIEDLFPLPADVINRAYLKPSIRPVAEEHLIYAF